MANAIYWTGSDNITFTDCQFPDTDPPPYFERSQLAPLDSTLRIPFRIPREERMRHHAFAEARQEVECWLAGVPYRWRPFEE